jgi:hypothetical protein
VVDLAKLEAMNAIWVAAKTGRKEKLLAYLRSNKPLTARDRAYLADYLEGKFKRKKGRPPGGDAARNLRNVAALVDYIKAMLRESGKRYRIHDLAVDYALNHHVAHGHRAPTREALENYLRRSKRRKK